MSVGAWATLVVAIAFTALLVWVLAPSNRARFDRYARMALDDDDAPHREDCR